MVLVRLFTPKTFRAIIAFIALWIGPNAFAWEICNETSYIMRVATVTPQQDALIPKGWERTRPGQCLSMDIRSGEPRYVYAESSRSHQGGIREWVGTHSFCANDDNFEAKTDISCTLQDMETRNYLSIDPSEQRTSFVEPLNYNDKASIAGLQRLLRDNGYTIAQIDGLNGRQTSRALTDFLKKNDLASSLSEAEKIDALETGAIARQDEVGIHICNETDSRIWAALAYRLGAGWESRGWWPIETQTCERPHTASIKNIDAHIFTLLERYDEEGAPQDDLILKSNTAVPAQFCIAESRFSATERTNCVERGYSAASFRPLPSSEDGHRITLNESDFAPKKVGGLRQ